MRHHRTGIPYGIPELWPLKPRDVAVAGSPYGRGCLRRFCTPDGRRTSLVEQTYDPRSDPAVVTAALLPHVAFCSHPAEEIR